MSIGLLRLTFGFTAVRLITSISFWILGFVLGPSIVSAKDSLLSCAKNVIRLLELCLSIWLLTLTLKLDIVLSKSSLTFLARPVLGTNHLDVCPIF
jgi:hypothetical protein